MNCKEVVEYLNVEQLRRMVWEKLSYNELVLYRLELDNIIETNRRMIAKGLEEQLAAIYKRAKDFDLHIEGKKICFKEDYFGEDE